MAATDENVSLCTYVKRNFEIKVFPAKHFLGLEIRLHDGSIHLSQSQCILSRVVQRFNLAEAAVVSTAAVVSIAATQMRFLIYDGIGVRSSVRGGQGVWFYSSITIVPTD